MPSKTTQITGLQVENIADVVGDDPLAPLAAAFLATASGRTFPCTFVKGGISKRTLWGASVHPHQIAEAHALIGDYLRIVDDCASEKEAAMVVLLLDVEIDASLDADAVRDLAWRFLLDLHKHDAASGFPWPDTVPTDIDDTSWAYCLHGVRLFVNMTSSTLTARRSRNLGRKLVLVIQPTAGLHFIAPVNPVGDRIRERIRSRIDAYDDLPRSPALNNAGDEQNSDWRQTWLGNTNAPQAWTPPQIPACPARHRHDPEPGCPAS